MAVDGLWFLPCCSSSLWIYLVTFFVAICVVSSEFRFYVKFFLLGVQYTIVSIFVALLSLTSPGSAGNLHRASNKLLWTTKVWGIDFKVEGKENIKDGSNYIIVCNHQSSWDMLAMFYVFPPNTRIFAKKELYYTPVLGIAAWLGGVIFVDRKNHSEAINIMNKTVEQIKEEKCNVWVYPEGTRNQGDTLLPFKKGGFHLAQQCQIPILPIVFSDYRTIVNFKEKRFITGTIKITIFPELPTEGLGPSDVNELTEKTRQIMCNEYEQNKAIPR